MIIEVQIAFLIMSSRPQPSCSTLFGSKDWKGLSGKEKTAYTSPESGPAPGLNSA
jgi:hypothetical protein